MLTKTSACSLQVKQTKNCCVEAEVASFHTVSSLFFNLPPLPPVLGSFGWELAFVWLAV